MKNIENMICIDGFFCININTLFLIFIILIILLFYLYNKNNINLMKDKYLNDKIREIHNNKINIYHKKSIEENDLEKINNPLKPPEYRYHNNNTNILIPPSIGIPINIKTQGFDSSFQNVGTISYMNESTNENIILPMYGRKIMNNKYNYYTQSNQYNLAKIKLNINGKDAMTEYGVNEISDGDIVTVPSYGNKSFTVEKYGLEGIRYIPYV